MDVGIPWWIGAGDPVEGIEHARSMGADFVEVSLDPPWPGTLDGEALRQRAHEAGIDVGLHGPWRTLALAHPDPELAEAARSVMQRCVSFAEVCGAAYVVVHVDARDFSGYPEPEIVQEGLEHARASLAAMRSGMGETMLLVENTSSPMGTPEEIERFLAPVDGVGVCFDPGHAALVEEADIEGGTSRVEDWTGALGDRLNLVHAMDWTHHEGGIVDHLLPGAGDADVEGILHAAQDAGCTRVMVEAFFRDADRAEVQDDDLRDAVHTIKQWA